MITPSDFPGVDEDVARRIIVAARSIAPCIDSFEDETENKKNALAILRGVAAEAADRPARTLVSTGVGPMREQYRDIESNFSAEDRRLLRSLCGAPVASGMPRGSFPRGGFVTRLWPEQSL